MCVPEMVSLNTAAFTQVIQEAVSSCVFHFQLQNMMHDEPKRTTEVKKKQKTKCSFQVTECHHFPFQSLIQKPTFKQT